MCYVRTFKYRLQPLLDLKVDRKSQLQMAVAQCQNELSAEQEALAQLRREESQLEEKLAERRRNVLTGSDGSTGLAVQQYKDHLSGLAADLQLAKNSVFSQLLRVREFEEKVAETRRQLTECSREVDVLSKHRDRLQRRFLRVAQANEAAQHDEIGTTMFIHGRRANEGR